MKKATLKVIGQGGQFRLIDFTYPILLSELLAMNGFAVDMPCGGQKRCLKCKVKVTGSVIAISREEAALLSSREIADNIRYACMTEVVGDICLYFEDKGEDGMDVLTEWSIRPFSLDNQGRGYGIAVDIGTTTIAAYLYKLEDGKLLHSAADINPQTLYGADVISRIEQAMSGRLVTLANTIQTALSRLLQSLVLNASLSLSDIDNIVLTGNTAMLYLLCGKDPSSIARAPFESETLFGEFINAKKLSLPFDAEVYLPRCISAYVGADMVSALLAAGLFDENGVTGEEEMVLLVDIGTNGEMALKNGDRLLCCSTAAGPAFEGAGIMHGMAAKPGAICKVELWGEQMYLSVLGDVEPKGICGSGLLDAVACMLSAGIIDETGIINSSGHAFSKFISETDGQPAFTLPGTSIKITQKDIRAVQLAKSAICAGILTLVGEVALSEGDAPRLIIAGGFGSKINIYSAEKIGLIPEGYAKRATAIGNAAGAGAAMILLNEKYRTASERINQYAVNVELSGHPVFAENFINQMLF